MQVTASDDGEMVFARLLVSLRYSAGLTQEELAERAELTPRALSGMERGQVRRPQRGTVQRLVHALGLAGADAEHFVVVARGHRPMASRAPTGVPGSVSPSLPLPPSDVQTPDARAVPVPAQLPSDVRPFRGRLAQIAVLEGLLRAVLTGDAGPGLCLITGPTGVGKTALAVRWAHRVADRFPDGQLYVDLRGHGRQHPLDPADALAVLLRSLGMGDTAMAGGTAERSGQLRSLLARRRTLILLDDARSIEQIRPLLPGSGRSFCLVTSQDRLPGLIARDGATGLPLELFDLEEATALLSDLIPDGPAGCTDGNRSTLERIAERCARLPLALRIAAERIATHPELSLTDHARQLEQAGPLEALHAGGDDRSAIRTVLSWSVDQLEPDVKEAFEQLGAHPGREWDAAAASVLTERPRDQVALLLEDLARAHLVQRISLDRWRQHDLLRAFAAERAAADPDRRRRALIALSEHYLDRAGAALDVLVPGERDLRPRTQRGPAGPGRPRSNDEPDDTPTVARDWLHREQPNVLAVLLQAHDDGLHEQAIRLAVMWRRPLELCGAYGDGVDAFLYAHASALSLADPVGEADCLRALACFHYLRDEHETSIRMFGEALDIARVLDDPARVCRALSGLGVAETRVDRHAAAQTHLEEALALSEGTRDLTGALTVRVNLAFLDYRRGRLDQAAAQAQAALAGFCAVGSLHGEMHARQLLGDVCLAAGDPSGALAEFRQAWSCADQIGDRSMLAKAVVGAERALTVLGDAHGRDALRLQIGELLLELGLDDEAARELVAAR